MSIGSLTLNWRHTSIILILVLALMVASFDWGARYLSWHGLSKAELISSAKSYVAKRAPNTEACLYAVRCDRGAPTMELVKSVDDWDLEAAKSLTWARRFEGKCPGRTANFGLELISKKPDDGVKLSKRKRAVWSFFNDRFVPVQGRFHGPHAFSETAAEPCTGEFDITKTMVGQ